MSKIVTFPDKSRIEEEAGYWLVRLDSGLLSDEETREFHAWLESSPEHRKVIVELSAMWDNMDVLSELSDLFPLPQKPDSKPLHRWLKTRLLFPVFAAAASIILVLAIMVDQNVWLHDAPAPLVSQNEDIYRTDVGENRTVSLSDGSVIKLNTDSFVSIDFTATQRRLYLIKGEAHFRVADDSSRPFVVHAGSGFVRAVGTAFSVRLKGPDVEVTVTEGRVEIASTRSKQMSDSSGNIDSGNHLATLDAGQTAEFGNNIIHSLKTISPEIISRKMSWQNGTLIFKGETLEEVVREISRYTDTRIIISDPALRDIRIGGYFKTGEVEALLTVLKDNFSIEVDRVSDNLVYLTGEKVIRADRGE